MTLNSSIGLTAAMLAVLLVGCGEKKDPAPVPEAPKVVKSMTAAEERMNDSAYVKQLDELMAKKKDALVKMNKAQEALKKAEAEGVGEGKIAELKAAVERAVKNFKACENEARQVVSQRMQASIIKTNGSQEGK